MTLGQLINKMQVGGPVGLLNENTFYGGVYDNPDIYYSEWGSIEGIVEECDPELLDYEVVGIDSGESPDGGTMLVIGLENWEGVA